MAETKEYKRTMTMDFDAFVDDEHDDFFDAYSRASSAALDDLTSSDSEDDDFEDSRMSFSSVVSAAATAAAGMRREVFVCPYSGVVMEKPNFHYWTEDHGGVEERRKRLFVGMGIMSNKKLLKEDSINFSRKLTEQLSTKHMLPPAAPKASKPKAPAPPPSVQQPECPAETTKVAAETTKVAAKLVRSRSGGEIDEEAKRRKEEMIGEEVKEKLKRTRSDVSQIGSISVPASLVAAEKRKSHKQPDPVVVSGESEVDQSAIWNKMRDMSGKKVGEEEFENNTGYSPVVKELMRRESISHQIVDSCESHAHHKSVSSKSIKLSKRRGALFKILSTNIKSSSKRHCSAPSSPERGLDHKASKKEKEKETASSHWIKVRHNAKTHKDLSALHMSQEIEAHEGSIWTMRFSPDGKYLASAGEDKTIHIWEVQECEVTSLSEEGASTPYHPSPSKASPAHPLLADAKQAPSGKKKKWRKKNSIPDYVHVPETVFSLSEKPTCSLAGHTEDVLDLSWSKAQLLISSSMDKTVRLWDMETKSCLKTFSHNDYVTGIHFNPAHNNLFISGSLDGKVRIWNIDDLSVASYTEVYEMVTAVSYSLDGQDALIGTHKGNYRQFGTDDCKLEEKGTVETQKTKNQTKKIKKVTGFQFHPKNTSEVLVTCADSRIRIFNGEVVVHKFKGFKNTSSQIAASFCKDGKYVLSASEDSQVYLWKREGHRIPGTGKGKGKVRIKTRSYEHFFCRDVSVATPWPCSMRGEPQVSSIFGRSKKRSKRLHNAQPAATDSPPVQDGDSGVLGSSNSDSSPAASGRLAQSPSVNAATSNQSSSSWSWLDIGIRGLGSGKVTAWGLVIVTASLTGEIRVYQNFGLPRRLSRQATLFMNKET